MRVKIQISLLISSVVLNCHFRAFSAIDRSNRTVGQYVLSGVVLEFSSNMNLLRQNCDNGTPISRIFSSPLSLRLLNARRQCCVGNFVCGFCVLKFEPKPPCTKLHQQLPSTTSEALIIFIICNSLHHSL